MSWHQQHFCFFSSLRIRTFFLQVHRKTSASFWWRHRCRFHRQRIVFRLKKPRRSRRVVKGTSETKGCTLSQGWEIWFQVVLNIVFAWRIRQPKYFNILQALFKVYWGTNPSFCWTRWVQAKALSLCSLYFPLTSIIIYLARKIKIPSEKSFETPGFEFRGWLFWQKSSRIA